MTCKPAPETGQSGVHSHVNSQHTCAKGVNMKHNAIDTTLARRNYDKLREAGIPPERAYGEADRWALFDVEVLGHAYEDGQLLVRLCGTGPGAVEYTQQFHLGRNAA